MCVLLEPFSHFNAIILCPFQDFELAVFKPFFMKMFKLFFETSIFIVFGGLTPIDWTSKRFLQSFKIKCSSVAFLPKNC